MVAVVVNPDLIPTNAQVAFTTLFDTNMAKVKVKVAA